MTNVAPLSELLLKVRIFSFHFPDLSFQYPGCFRLQCVDDSQAEVRDAAYSVISLLSKFHGDAFTQELSEGDLDRAKWVSSSLPSPPLLLL